MQDCAHFKSCYFENWNDITFNASEITEVTEIYIYRIETNYRALRSG